MLLSSNWPPYLWLDISTRHPLDCADDRHCTLSSWSVYCLPVRVHVPANALSKESFVLILTHSLIQTHANMCFRYAASLFAASDFTRCTFALAAVLFSRPMYTYLGMGKACTLLAGLMIGCIFGLFALHHYGPRLRQRSKFGKK